MDLRDIQRMHEQYAQGPITIDVDAAPVAALGAPAKAAPPAQPAARATLFAALDGNKRLIGMMLLVAAVSLPVGMLLASANKRSSAPTAATTPATGPSEQPAGARPAEAIQWPGTKELATTEAELAKPAVAAPPSPAVASAVQVQKKVQTSRSEPVEARKPDATAHAPNRPAPKAGPASGDVKLF
ncbi:conserved protein of unknown function (plasmid) [Cupriavidus taiwanensis]|uniref:Transmembrane protein n=1 Tax=Cupriavidus taiwanensis TaxID=164546 RepID=A0A375IV34_9BURK|nr:hypothetical protein [Cupriavidus taiwanensis]SPK77489.1 conserved protein of unknown function [Cupriavidus taiwanensis]